MSLFTLTLHHVSRVFGEVSVRLRNFVLQITEYIPIGWKILVNIFVMCIPCHGLGGWKESESLEGIGGEKGTRAKTTRPLSYLVCQDSPVNNSMQSTPKQDS